jgi:hypothetical protein
MAWPHRKAIARTAALVAIAFLGSTLAQADDAHAAIVIGQGAAKLLDANKKGCVVTDYHKVVTQSKNRNVILKLRARGVPNNTGKAVHWDYSKTRMRCRVWVNHYGYVYSKEWRETISASGNAVFTCRVKVPK